MKPRIISYSLYYSQNSYLGVLYAYQKLSQLPVEVVRRPIHIPRSRGVLVAELLGGKESPVKSAYNREDCTRWARSHGIPISFIEDEMFRERVSRWATSVFEREELPARAYYASLGSGREEVLDRSFFRASFVAGLDVNEMDVVRTCVSESGLNIEEIMERAFSDEIGEMLNRSLQEFEKDGCPGVPTWVLKGERFWGKDRVDMLVERIHSL
jgi:2-hydroxychromene-2-carboxylate isomerase